MVLVQSRKRENGVWGDWKTFGKLPNYKEALRVKNIVDKISQEIGDKNLETRILKKE